MSTIKKTTKKAGLAMSAPIDPEIKSMIADDGPMTSTQYAILMENERKKQALSEYKSKYMETLAENQKLRENDEMIRKEAFEVTEFLRRDLKSKINRIQDYRDALEAESEKFEIFRANAEQETEQKLAEQREKYEARIMEVMEQLDNACGQMNSLQTFKNEKEQIVQEQSRLRKENEEMKRNHKEILSLLEKKYLDQLNRQKREGEIQIEEIKRKEEMEFFDRMGKAVQLIHVENKELSKELFTHVQVSGQLHREKEDLIRLLEECRREIDIKSDIQEEQAKRTTKYNRDIKEARKKITNLESCIDKLTHLFEARQQELLQSSDETIAGLKNELVQAKRIVKVRGKELRRLRTLASQVLAQRTDVERFLIDSLAYVQREISQSAPASAPGQESQEQEDARSLPEHPQTSPSPRLSRLSSRSIKSFPVTKSEIMVATSHQPRGSTAAESSKGSLDTCAPGSSSSSPHTVDIGELTWPEREQVLRILFAKINSVPSKLQPESSMGGQSTAVPQAQDEDKAESGESELVMTASCGEEPAMA